jgi:C4-type Zn-finger protein
MSYQYLQPKQCYEDRYDLQTIKECLEQLQIVENIDQRMRLQSQFKNYPESEMEKNIGLVRGRLLFFTQAQRHKLRDSTISEWMEKDRTKQDKQDNAQVPKMSCPECGTSMVADDFRHLEDWPEDKPMRVLFILNCPKCKKREGVYDDGKIHTSKSDFCPECNEKLDVTNSRKGKVITTLFSCKHCGYSKKDILDLKKSDDEHKKWEEEHERKEQKDKQLLEKYRAEFCLSEKEGKEYVETLEAMEVAHEVKEEILAEMDTPAHEKLLSVHKISITDLEAVINKALVDSGFSRLSIGNPEIDRYVIVPFTLQDIKPKRRDLESTSDLYDLLKPKMEETNWRVPKDQINYRLGFLSGKLKGYESEEDLLKLFGKEEPKKPKSKLDPAFRAKYEHHHFVQLVRLEAEYEVTKRIRTRRLKDEPEGFFLNDGGRGYTCGICRDNYNGEDIWWRPDGLRCRDCWKNIQEGVIPMLNLDSEWWEKEFFTKFDLTYDYKIHPSSIRKLRKEGTLIGRDLKYSTGQAYETIYLVSENQDFLKKYPKVEK